ncbi:uncharacterized protein METZ01_LOCUS377675, partial [marine metagenome]
MAVERPVLEGFGDVFRVNVVRSSEVGDRAADFQNPVVRAGAQVQFVHRHSQQVLRLVGELAMLLDVAGLHAGVAGDVVVSAEALLLKLPGGNDAFTDARRRFSVAIGRDFLKLYLGHLDVQIDPVEQRAA